MLLVNNQDYFTFELEYKLTNKGKIKIFDNSFVNKKRDKCIIIYEGNGYELTNYFHTDYYYNNKDSIKIQIRINNNIKDISYMY